ncbi:MAG: zinc-binding dehydrogenase, partial [Pseudomonadales bacterium]|nr:zinc-binding dehydrogenase [Pseudomonadales bacterium]
RSLYKIPDSNLADQHWVVEPASCVVTGIDCCRIKVGERLALVGCGFMGLMMVQGLQGMGLDQLIALDVDDRRLELAKEFGATEAHNVTSDGFDDVKRDLLGRGIDVVVDTSGAQSGLDLATEIVRRAGLINLFGWIKGTEATFNPTTWHGKAIYPFPPAIRLIQNGVIDLRPLVTHVVPIEEFPSFMSEATSGHVNGYIKGVITTGA